MTTVAIHGAHGRMGQRLQALALHDERFANVVAIGRNDTLADDVDVDVIVDFSSPQGTARALAMATERTVSLMIGTTGLSREMCRQLDDSARCIPVLIASNTSVGIAVMRYLAAEAARLLPETFDINLVEAHHAAKLDAPSGTAHAIVDAIASGSARTVDPSRVTSIRAGDIVGEHEISFSGQHQRVQLRHEAGSRDVFAAGALDAAAWLVTREPGCYRMEDVLGLPSPGGR